MKTWTKEERYRLLTSPDEIAELHRETAASSYRQTYHIQPVSGLLNDPNGFVFHEGKWHLYYQWCPWGAVHGLKYWYETVSDDLIYWKNLGVSIKPDTDKDNKGAYSGSALVTDHSIYLYYTGNHRDADWKRTAYTCLVNRRDDGSIHKYSMPLFGPHPNYTEHQRDPKIIYHREKNLFYIILGAQTKDKKGCILIYQSKTFNKDWQFAGQLNVPGFEDFGDMWECPSIEKINGQDVLLFCPQHLTLENRGKTLHHNGYLIGEMNWDELTFTPSGQFHVLDFGFDSYAAECAANLDENGHAILVAWMGLPDAAYPTDEENWQGCLTLPRELTIRGRRLIQKPLDRLVNLRQEKVEKLQRACEIEVCNTGGSLDLTLFSSPHTKGLSIRYDDSARTITIDRSGMIRRFNTEQGECRTRPLENGLKMLRIFVDHSSVEIFVNDGDAVFTSRIFPTEEESGFELHGEAKTTIWKLKPSVTDDFVV